MVSGDGWLGKWIESKDAVQRFWDDISFFTHTIGIEEDFRRAGSARREAAGRTGKVFELEADGNEVRE